MKLKAYGLEVKKESTADKKTGYTLMNTDVNAGLKGVAYCIEKTYSRETNMVDVFYFNNNEEC